MAGNGQLRTSNSQGSSESSRRFSVRIALMAFVLLFALSGIPGVGPSLAYGDENGDGPKTAYELQQQVEEAQNAYSEAREEADKAAEAVEAHEQRIAEIQEEIPEQQKRSAGATRELYKLQQQSVGIINMLLSAESFGDFIRQMEYLVRISDSNYAEIHRLNALKQELDSTHDELRQARSEADARVSDARKAMDDALEAQAEVQRRIEEDAAMEAAAAVNSVQLAEDPRDNASSTPGTGGSGNGGGGSTPTDPGNTGGSGDSGGASVPSGGGDVASWAARINAYLAGTPMAGQGYTFAQAAFTYGVHPAFSPAIACVESGKGVYCFLPYNAWGWGAVSWGSWEEAINSHVRGLARGYGYSPTIEGAKMYCPPNWQHWYNSVVAQMNLI